MRCKACDRELTDREAVRKDERGEFLDLCGSCGRESWLTENFEDYDPERYSDQMGEDLYHLLGIEVTPMKQSQ